MIAGNLPPSPLKRTLGAIDIGFGSNAGVCAPILAPNVPPWITGLEWAQDLWHLTDLFDCSERIVARRPGPRSHLSTEGITSTH